MISVNTGGDVWVTIHGDLDELNVPQLRSILRDIPVSTPVVIDLTNCTFIHSAGINSIVPHLRRAESSLRVLVAKSGIVPAIFAICGLKDRLTFMPPSDWSTN